MARGLQVRVELTDGHAMTAGVQVKPTEALTRRTARKFAISNFLILAVVLLALILVQEGVGTLDFGTSVLWYLLVITLFFIGRWMFETENWLLLSGCIGLAHYGVIWLMTRLQFIPLDTTQLLDESILQALLTPFVWQCSMMARRWVVPNENNTA